MLLFSQTVHSREDQVRETYHKILVARQPYTVRSKAAHACIHPYKAKLPFLYGRRSLSVHAASQN